MNLWQRERKGGEPTVGLGFQVPSPEYQVAANDKRPPTPYYLASTVSHAFRRNVRLNHWFGITS